MVGDLCAVGVTPRKTMSLAWPSIREDLYRHYIRGYVDGDGGFYVRTVRNTTYLQHWFSVTSYDGFIRSLQSHMAEALGLSYTKLTYRRPSSPVCTLKYSGRRQVLKIAHFLYDDATVWLDRKRKTILG
jgi:intein-encoded DNA endonuclease-like protein